MQPYQKLGFPVRVIVATGTHPNLHGVSPEKWIQLGDGGKYRHGCEAMAAASLAAAAVAHLRKITLRLRGNGGTISILNTYKSFTYICTRRQE